MNILSIETSCDETAIAILEVKGSKNPVGKILAHSVASQIKLHAEYGGVFPAMAKREHAKNILPLFLKTLNMCKMLKNRNQNSEGTHTLSFLTAKTAKESVCVPSEFSKTKSKKITEILSRENDLGEIFLSEISKIKKPKIDKIVVTVGPGLTPALWVGISFAKALSIAWDIPITPVNHMEGHLLSTLISNPNDKFKLDSSSFKLPAISLLVSGGHTEIVLIKKIGKYKIIGRTRDDAAGEAFDKVARMLGLAYPGGPLISKTADEFRKSKLISTTTLPRPMMHSKDFDFSFSGLKTSVLYLLRDLGEIDQNKKNEIACEFENSVVDVLTHKTFSAIKKFDAKCLIVGGGVSANKELKKRFEAEGAKINIPVFFPNKELSTDNAIMIAIAGYFAKSVSLSSKKLIAVGNLEL